MLDMRLPDGNGLDLCHEFNEIGDCIDQPPIMVLSAHGDPRLPTRCRQAGVRAFLDKLHDLDTFVDTAWRLIRESPFDPASEA